MKKIHVLIITVFSICSGCTGEDKHPVARTLKFETLARAEIVFAENLNRTLNTLVDPRLANKYIKSFEAGNLNLKGYTNSTGGLEDKVNAVTWNPLALYHMVHRFLNELSELKDDLTDVNSTLLESFPPNLKFAEADLNETMENILEACHAHNLNVTAFVDGVLLGTDIGGKLSAKDCYDIGILAGTGLKLGLSVMFLEEAARKVVKDHTMDQGVIEFALNQSIKRHDKAFKNKPEPVNEDQFLFNRKLGPLRKRQRELYKQIRVYQRATLGRIPMENFDFSRQPKTVLSVPHFYEACEHGNLLTDDERKELFCWLETSLNPYWRINPLKMEIHSKVPELLQIYDILGKKKREFLKKVATTQANDRDLDQITNAETVLFEESDRPKIRNILQGMEKITGLSIYDPNSPQRIRVASMRPGLTANQHYDRQQLRGSGFTETASTFLYYIENTEVGGATVFVHAKVAITPVEGSAIYWANKLSDGDWDENPVHGGCPVIFGRKWIATKFIDYREQFLNMKCGVGASGASMPLLPKSKLLQRRFYRKKITAGSDDY